MKKKVLSLLMIGLSVAMLTGCGEVVKKSTETATIDFSWWGKDNRHMYTMDGVNLFQEKNPDIKVDYTYGEWSGYERKNRVWMESHTEADVMQINYAWLSTYSADGNGYYDLNELKDYIDLSSFDEKDLEYGMIDGKLNAIPIAFNTSTVAFNKDLYDKYNLEYPKNWDDLFKAAEEFSKDDIYVLGMAKKHLLLMLIAYYEQTTGKNVFDKDGNLLIDEEGIGYMLDFYKELIDKKVLIPMEQFDDKTTFASGKITGCVFWISDADNYCDALEDKGYTPEISKYFLNENADLSGIYMKPATMYAVSNVTEHPEQAAKLLDYLVNDTDMAILQGTEKGVPVSKKAVQYLEENGALDSYGYMAYENMQEEKDILNVMIPIMESEEIIDAFKKNADAYIYDVGDRDEIIKTIYEEIKSIVEK